MPGIFLRLFILIFVHNHRLQLACIIVKLIAFGYLVIGMLNVFVILEMCLISLGTRGARF